MGVVRNAVSGVTEQAAKEAAMLQQEADRLRAELTKIATALQRQASDQVGAVERPIGRWLGRYPAAAAVFTVRFGALVGEAAGPDVNQRPIQFQAAGLGDDGLDDVGRRLPAVGGVFAAGSGTSAGPSLHTARFTVRLQSDVAFFAPRCGERSARRGGMPSSVRPSESLFRPDPHSLPGPQGPIIPSERDPASARWALRLPVACFARNSPVFCLEVPRPSQ